MLDRVSGGDVLVVLFEDCEGRRMDEDVDGTRDCDGTTIASFTSGSSSWTSIDVSRLIEPDVDGRTSISLHALNDLLLVEGWKNDGTQQLTLADPIDLSVVGAAQPAPPEFASRYALDSSCPVGEGLLVWATGYTAPDGRPIPPDPSDPLEIPDEAGASVDGMSVAVLSDDGIWSPPAAITGRVPSPSVLGCQPESVVLATRVVDPKIPPTSQRIEAIALDGEGDVRPLPIDLGPNPRKPTPETVDLSAHPPAVIRDGQLWVYIDLERPTRCAFAAPISGSVVMTPSADVIFHVLDEPSDPTRQTYDLARCE